MKTKILPKGFSNLVLYTDDLLGLQFRVLDDGADSVRFECHYGLWGGGHESCDSHDPYVAMMREIKEELSGIEVILVQ